MRANQRVCWGAIVAMALAMGLGLGGAASGQVVIPDGDDGWQTPAPTPDGIETCATDVALPAGFFGVGSDPFLGTVCFVGDPLSTTPGGAIAPIDTIVRRLEDTIPLNPGDSDTIDIEIVALSLVSVAPITVTFNGGLNPTDFDVELCLSEFGQTTGTMTITLDNPDGGTFDTDFDVVPKFIFDEVGGGSTFTLDPGPTAAFLSSGNRWARTGGACSFDPVAFGITEIPPGVDVDGDCNGSFEYTTVGTTNFYPGMSICVDLTGCGAPTEPLCVLTEEDALLASHDVEPAGCDPPHPSDKCGDGILAPSEECEFGREGLCAGPHPTCNLCTCTCDGPLAITLTEFSAAAEAGGVMCSWSTESEIDNLGFNVLRSTDAAATGSAVNPALILSEGGPAFGADYQFLDETVEPGVSYDYRLQDIDTSGVSTLHGAEACTIGVDPGCEPIEVMVPGLSAADFCGQLERGSACLHGDWKGNEPEHRNPRDCKAVRGSCVARPDAD